MLREPFLADMTQTGSAAVGAAVADLLMFSKERNNRMPIGVTAKLVDEHEDEIEGAKRWLVEIDYKTANGIVTVDHHIEELLALQNLVERGPDWNTLEQIRIVLNPERGNPPTI